MQQITLEGQPTASAVISECEQYRYRLERGWDPKKGTVLVIMLNPSTADGTQDDPTIRRLINFARQWGFGRLLVGNLFALRSTNPKNLYHHPEPIGAENDRHLLEMAKEAQQIIAAWGNHGGLLNRAEFVRQIIPDLFHLGLTQIEHQPKHPLYLPSSTQPVKWGN